MTCKISLSNLHCQPYSGPDRLPADLSKDYSVRSPRTEFIIFPSHKFLDLQFRVANSRYDYEVTGVRGTLVATLEDESGETLATASSRFNIKAAYRFTWIRMTMDIDPSRLKTMVNYRVRFYLSAPNGRMEEVDTPYNTVRFIALPEVRILPTKWYRPVAGYISGFTHTSFDEKRKNMRSPGSTASGHVRIMFLLENHFPARFEHLPELEIRMVTPTGAEFTDIAVSLLTGESSQSSEYSEYSEDSERSECSESSKPVPLMETCVELPIDTSTRGVYYAELLSMGYSVTGFLFSTEGEPVFGEWTPDDQGLDKRPLYTPAEGEIRFAKLIKSSRPSQPSENSENSENSESSEWSECSESSEFSELSESSELSSIDDLVGLSSLKSRIESYARMAKFNKQRRSIGLPEVAVPLHCMFLGSPGTGKTTVAKILGRRLREAGILSEGHVVVRERSTLCGQFYNSEAENTLKALEEARGGILFIDEAYQLFQPADPKDPGKFVIEALMTALADTARRDWMLILAGYTEPMRRIFKINPGLRSRIPSTNIFLFEDFTEGELMEIALSYMKRNSFILSPEAEVALRLRLSADWAARDSEFGNGRHVVNLIETEILPAMADRVDAIDSPTPDDLRMILAEDIPAPVKLLPKRRRLGFAV